MGPLSIAEDKQVKDFVLFIRRHFLSDYSRNQIKQLLYFSFLTLLLGSGILLPGKGDFFGLYFPEKNFRYVALIGAASCLFLLIQFMIMMQADYQRWQVENELKFHDSGLFKLLDKVFKKFDDNDEKRYEVHKKYIDDPDSVAEKGDVKVNEESEKVDKIDKEQLDLGDAIKSQIANVSSPIFRTIQN